MVESVRLVLFVQCGSLTRYYGHFSQILSNYSLGRHPVCKNSALARIKQKRAEMKAAARN
jgi:hypothetical protein